MRELKFYLTCGWRENIAKIRYCNIDCNGFSVTGDTSAAGVGFVYLPHTKHFISNKIAGIYADSVICTVSFLCTVSFCFTSTIGIS